MPAAPAEVFVLVPSFNHARFVERCLHSIIKQTAPPAKLLVIDDGSNDDSAVKIEKILSNCPFPAEFIARENRGLSATLNEGLEQSEGEYFAYLGSDDVWLPEFLASRSRVLEKNPAAVLTYGHAFLIDEEDRIFDSTAEWWDFDGGDFLPALLRAEIFASSSVVYRRAALEETCWNENSILEDYEFYLKLAKRGEFAFDPRILSAWRIHDDNTSGDFAKMLTEWLAAQTRIAPELGIADEELLSVQQRLQFDSALNFIRRGEKRRAWQMIRENWRAAESPQTLAKTLFRLSIPRRALRWHRANKRRAAIQKYGKLEI